MATKYHDIVPFSITPPFQDETSVPIEDYLCALEKHRVEIIEALRANPDLVNVEMKIEQDWGYGDDPVPYGNFSLIGERTWSKQKIAAAEAKENKAKEKKDAAERKEYERLKKKFG